MLNGSIQCPVCLENLLLKAVTIDPFFLQLLHKYKEDSSCVIDRSGLDHSLSEDDKKVVFKLVPGRLESSIKRDLPMLISSLP
jgi:hypothetical protein